MFLPTVTLVIRLKPWKMNPMFLRSSRNCAPASPVMSLPSMSTRPPRRAFQQVDGAYQCGFSGSGESYDAEYLAFAHTEAHMFDRFDGSSAFVERDRHIVQFDDAHYPSFR